jgi:Cu/Ag efflux protein CusF
MAGRVSIFAMAIALAAAAAAQKPQAARAIGEVTAVDSAARKLAIRTDAGASVAVALTDATSCLRVPPGEKDLSKAARIAPGEIGAGDRVLVRGEQAADGRTLEAATVVVMTKSDLAHKQAADRAEWQRRGVAGYVLAVDEAAKQFTMSVGPRDSGHTLIVEPAGDAQFRRYAPDSIRFADAVPGAFAELKEGDGVRVLGDKSSDATRIKAEEIVSGSFRSIAAEVKSVDAAAGEIHAADLQTKKPLTIRVTPDSELRRMPPQLAAMLARRREPGPGAPAQAGSVDLQQMLERMPALTLAELKPGDAIIVSGTNGSEPSRIAATTLIAGVDPIFAARGGAQQGAWNFDIGMGLQ